QDARLYEEWKWFRCPTLPEVLAEFPSVALPAALLLSQLPLLQPRYYSISSAPGAHPGEIHLTVAVVTYHSESEWGQGGDGAVGAPPGHREGPQDTSRASSGSLQGLQSVSAVPRTPPGDFRGPSTPSGPLQGYGDTGTQGHSAWGLRDTVPTGGPLGPMVLVFGCRSSALDHIYCEEMEQAREQGALSQVLTAFSRQPGTPK
ncbi:NOS3 protein, partial [Scytalopus superciliaris]|nr:NOS3 protein [Scytalopus superciliaris]